MKIVHVVEIPKQEGRSGFFTGPVSMQPAFTDMESQFTVTTVNFEVGVRNKFHTHSSDQVLIVTQGRGLVVTDSEQIEIAEGDIVFAPAGEKHWHGAAPGSTMTHITITASGNETKQVED